MQTPTTEKTYLERNPITLQLLQKIDAQVPESASAFVPYLNQAAFKYKIDTRLRLALFLAHLMVESQHMQRTVENLNYSADGLLSTFGRHRISEAQAKKYGRIDAAVRRRTGWNLKDQKANQEAIANIVYGGAWGAANLGNTQPGDGWRLRGRSLVQTTGRWNYGQEGKDLGVDLLSSPELLETPKYAVDSAGNFWRRKGLNEYADRGDVAGSTKRINGGTSHLKERTDYYNAALKHLPR